jgi:hypothetical protein
LLNTVLRTAVGVPENHVSVTDANHTVVTIVDHCYR